jgi:hypothetical protein
MDLLADLVILASRNQSQVPAVHPVEPEINKILENKFKCPCFCKTLKYENEDIVLNLNEFE